MRGPVKDFIENFKLCTLFDENCIDDLDYDISVVDDDDREG